MNVYDPAEDSYLIKEFIPKYAYGRVLEMGTGSGILALEAAKSAKSVVAIDINENAIIASKAAAFKQRALNIEFIVSNLFEKVSGVFDCIIFNPPYLPSDKKYPDPALDGGKKGFEVILEFMRQAQQFLAPKGVILLLFSSQSKPSAILEAADNLLYTYEFIGGKKLFFEELFVVAISKTPLLLDLEKRGLKQIIRFAHGKRGDIIVSIKGKMKVAIKVARKPQFVRNIQSEAVILKKLNVLKIGPKVLFASGNLFGYKFVEGDLILDFLRKESPAQIKKVLIKVLRQCRRLDDFGINKLEMTHPHKHIIVTKAGPVLIDFERARFTKKPKNVTQFCQFIGGIQKELGVRGVSVDIESLRSTSKDYKKERSASAYIRIEKIIKTN